MKNCYSNKVSVERKTRERERERERDIVSIERETGENSIDCRYCFVGISLLLKRHVTDITVGLDIVVVSNLWMRPIRPSK